MLLSACLLVSAGVWGEGRLSDLWKGSVIQLSGDVNINQAHANAVSEQLISFFYKPHTNVHPLYSYPIPGNCTALVDQLSFSLNAQCNILYSTCTAFFSQPDATTCHCSNFGLQLQLTVSL